MLQSKTLKKFSVNNRVAIATQASTIQLERPEVLWILRPTTVSQSRRTLQKDTFGGQSGYRQVSTMDQQCVFTRGHCRARYSVPATYEVWRCRIESRAEHLQGLWTIVLWTEQTGTV